MTGQKAEKVTSLARRRGFFWPSYEIYGGVAGMYTWGPYGAILKNKIANLWREVFLNKHGFIEIQSPSISPYIVFKASGHVDSFKDVMVTCLSCGRKFRVDTLLKEAGIEVKEGLTPEEYEKIIKENNVKCPICGGELGNASYFTTMFRTTIGPYSESIGFLRPETAQGIFTEFKRIYESMRKKMPLGVAQVGRGFRNEISPRQGVIRLREFDMMELELFYDPKEDKCPYINEYLDEPINILHRSLIEKGFKEGYETMSVREALEKGIIEHEWMAYFMVLSHIFLEMLGIPRSRQRFREKLEGEKAHYAKKTFDQEVLLDKWGWVEVSGHADRTDYDLSSHMKESGVEIFAERRMKTPKIIEKVEVNPRIDLIKSKYPDKVGEIMRYLYQLRGEEIHDIIKRMGYIKVGEAVLDEKFFEIKLVKKKLEVERFIPHVIEPSFGLDRLAYAVLEYAYTERGDRIILSLPPYLSPYDAAVYPLISKDDLLKYAETIYGELTQNGYSILYDFSDSIGRLYARGDEIGIPVAITVDFQSLNDDTVTVRDRDTWVQYRIDKNKISAFLDKILSGVAFEKACKDVNGKLYT